MSDNLNLPQKQVTAEHNEAQYAKFIQLVMTTFSGPRRERLLEMYNFLYGRLRTAPASTRAIYHYSYPGGYLDHVLHVIGTARLVTRLYQHIGGTVDFTDEELVFAAMHHDLGKLGTDKGPFYFQETDSYWLKKGFNYKYNKQLQLMSNFDRTMYMLQLYGVTVTQNEMMAMKMADGMFDPGNEKMFANNDIFPHRTSLVYIVHWADWMAAIAEKDEMRKIWEESINA